MPTFKGVYFVTFGGGVRRSRVRLYARTAVPAYTRLSGAVLVLAVTAVCARPPRPRWRVSPRAAVGAPRLPLGAGLVSFLPLFALRDPWP